MTQRIDRRKYLATIGGAGAIGLAGCLGDDDDDDDDAIDDTVDDDDTDDDPDPDAEEFDLGLLMGVTGGLEELGPPIRDASNAAVDQINDADVGLEINTLFEDTATQADDGVLGAESLRDAGVQAFVGALASDVSLPVAESVSIPDGIVQMSPASTAPAYTDLEGDWTFRTAASDAIQGPIVAELARDEGAETAAWIGRDDPYGRGLGEEFAAAFEDQGGEITAEVLIDPADDRFVSQLEEALGDDPDALFIVAFTEEATPLFSDFFGNFDPSDYTVIVPDGLRAEALPGDVGEDFSDFIGTQPTSHPDLESGMDTFTELVPNPDGAFVRQAYDAAAILALARAAAGEDDSTAIRDQLREVANPGGEVVTADNLPDGIELAADGEEVEYNGVSGPIEFDENGDVIEAAIEIWTWTEDDEIETLEVRTVEVS